MARITSRKIRVRKKLKSRGNRPRLSVFVSNKHIYAQIIDDKKGKTLVFAKDRDVKKKGKTIDTAREIGLLLATGAVKKGIKEVVFDRGERKYHGKIKTLAESAREGGLIF